MLRKSFVSFAVLAALFTSAGVASAQTVDEIVAKNFKAKGGEKWKTVQSMRMTARISTQGIELPMTIVSKRPNMMRQDMSFQGVSIVQAYDGTTAWAINPMAGSSEPAEVPGAVAESLKEQADFDGALLDYKAKGHTVELVGNEDLNGMKVHHLKLTKKTGKVQQYYIDAATGVEVKVVSEADLGAGPMKIETEMSNYQSVEGIMVPMTIRQNAPTGPVTITFDKVEFNVALDDKVFKMPGK
ncbi:MAG: outer membrane lipoprotein-sorting protein [Acidobacteriota bacterium]|nr:outer membrane lipoprotein-sorting protein [Acidobacteriota bacterium]